MNQYIVPFLTTLFFTTACSYNTGQMASHYTPSPNEKIEYMDIAVGYSKAAYFFGIGGINENLLYNNAKRNLFFSYPLKPNETIENITFDQKTKRIGPFKRIEVIAIGDVIRHEGKNSEQTYNSTYSSLVYNKEMRTKNYIELNETVLVYESSEKVVKAKVLNIGKKVTALHCDDLTQQIIKAYNYMDVFKTHDMADLSKVISLNIGDSINYVVKIATDVFGSGKTKIIALNRYKALIKPNADFSSIPLQIVQKIKN